MQTYLEKYGIESRKENLVHNDYFNEDTEYKSEHKDAISDGDIRGKGTGHGGHIHTIPNQDKPKSIDYSSFNTNNGGNVYDIEGFEGKGGRKYLQTISLYNEENQYGAHMIDTSANKADSQILM